jgi:hypothetical protein
LLKPLDPADSADELRASSPEVDGVVDGSEAALLELSEPWPNVLVAEPLVSEAASLAHHRSVGS